MRSVSRSTLVPRLRIGRTVLAAAALTATSAVVSLGCSTREGTLAPTTTSRTTSAGGSGGTIASGGTGAAAAGGSGGTATGTGGSTGNGGGAGSGGQGGDGACNPLDTSACALGLKCTVVDETTGTTGCATAGPLAAWHRCNADSDCAAGLWCDHSTMVCKPFCESAAHCPTFGNCLAAAAAGGDAIPGLRICTSGCDPMDPQCGPSTNCVYAYDSVYFDCAASLNFTDGSTCIEQSDCGSGLACADGTCLPWCDTPGDSIVWCKSGIWCCTVNPAVTYDGTELGVCNCP